VSLHLYGFVRKPEAPWEVLPGVEVIAAGELAALVGPVREERLGPAALARHHLVLARALALGTVAPCRFGTVAEGREEVRSFLEEAREELDRILGRLAGREEVAVKAFWKPEAVRRELGQRGGRTVTWSEALRVGQAVEAVLQRWREELAREAEREFRPRAELLWNESWAPRLLADLALLVPRERVPEIKKSVAALGSRFAGRLELKALFGLPPYSFSAVRWPASGREEG
jgi:hypothetical protein